MPNFPFASLFAVALAFSVAAPGVSPAHGQTSFPVVHGSAAPVGAVAAEELESPDGLAFLFEPNRGRAPACFDHLLRLPQGWAALGSNRVQLSVRAPMQGTALAPEAWQHLSIELVGAECVGTPAHEGRGGSWSSYRGADPSAWTRAARLAERLRYSGVWPGIDVLYHAGTAGLRYDFFVAAGRDPDEIRLRWHGVDRARIAPDGRLLLETAIGPLQQSAPHIFQSGAEGEESIGGGFVIHSHRHGVLELGFVVGEYDGTRTLVIDPYFSSFRLFGGSESERAEAVASDGAGNWFVAGSTSSRDFPYAELVPGQPVEEDIYLLKVTDGGIVTDSLILSGNGFDTLRALDYHEGRVALLATTTSTDMPIEGATFQGLNLGEEDAYVAVVDGDTFLLQWSSYLGGNSQELARDVAFASNGDVLVVGRSSSDDFPRVGPIDSGVSGIGAFVARFLADGSDLVWAGRYKVETSDEAAAVKGAPDGSAWVAGVDRVGVNTQAFVVRIATDGQVDLPRYFGGTGPERAKDLLLDGQGGFWLLGETFANDLDLVNALSIALNGPTDAFLVHCTADGSVDFSTYLGGSAREFAVALAPGVPAVGGAAVHVLLATNSGDVPLLEPMSSLAAPGFFPEDLVILGVGPAPGFDLVYSSYLPCVDTEYGGDLASDAADRLLVAGTVFSVGRYADLPATEPTLPAQFSGGTSAFLCWINNQASASPGTLRFGVLKDTLTLGQAFPLFAYRLGGASGATSATWAVYDPVATSLIPGLGGVFEFADGQQMATSTLLIPSTATFSAAALYVILQDPEGPVAVDTQYNIKELTLQFVGEPGPGEGSGASSGSSDDESMPCGLATIAGPGHGLIGLDRLRWVRDQVLGRSQSGRHLTHAYYQYSSELLRWLTHRPFAQGLLAVGTRALLWLVGCGEWVLLGAAGVALWRRQRRRIRAVRGMCAEYGGPRWLPA